MATRSKVCSLRDPQKLWDKLVIWDYKKAFPTIEYACAKNSWDQTKSTSNSNDSWVADICLDKSALSLETAPGVALPDLFLYALEIPDTIHLEHALFLCIPLARYIIRWNKDNFTISKQLSKIELSCRRFKKRLFGAFGSKDHKRKIIFIWRTSGKIEVCW